MSVKINSLEYLGSKNLARIFENPSEVISNPQDAAFHVDRAWFAPHIPKTMITIIPSKDRDLKKECLQYGGKGIIDLDLKGDATSPWYVISIDETDFGPSVSIYIPEDATAEAAGIVRAAFWEASK